MAEIERKTVNIVDGGTWARIKWPAGDTEVSLENIVIRPGYQTESTVPIDVLSDGTVEIHDPNPVEVPPASLTIADLTRRGSGLSSIACVAWVTYGEQANRVDEAGRCRRGQRVLVAVVILPLGVVCCWTGR
jgi:hypothetical protein